MSDRLPTRWHHPAPSDLPPGCQWWTDTAHQLAARLTREERRGQVARYGPRIEITPGYHGQVVRLLQPRPPAWRRVALVLILIAVAMGALTAGALALWSARYMVALILICLALAGAMVRSLAGHQGACPGIIVHCRCHR